MGTNVCARTRDFRCDTRLLADPNCPERGRVMKRLWKFQRTVTQINSISSARFFSAPVNSRCRPMHWSDFGSAWSACWLDCSRVEPRHLLILFAEPKLNSNTDLSFGMDRSQRFDPGMKHFQRFFVVWRTEFRIKVPVSSSAIVDSDEDFIPARFQIDRDFFLSA